MLVCRGLDCHWINHAFCFFSCLLSTSLPSVQHKHKKATTAAYKYSAYSFQFHEKIQLQRYKLLLFSNFLISRQSSLKLLKLPKIGCRQLRQRPQQPLLPITARLSQLRQQSLLSQLSLAVLHLTVIQLLMAARLLLLLDLMAFIMVSSYFKLNRPLISCIMQ